LKRNKVSSAPSQWR